MYLSIICGSAVEQNNGMKNKTAASTTEDGKTVYRQQTQNIEGVQMAQQSCVYNILQHL